MLAVEVDARHDVGAAEALRVLERVRGDADGRSRGRRAAAPRWWCRRRAPGREAGPRPRRAARRRAARSARRASPPGRAAAGSASSPSVSVSMRSAPRRRVWQRTVPGSASRVRQASRKRPLEVALLGRRRGQQLAARLTSTRHSRHLPCFTQEVGTWIAQRLGAVEERLAGPRARRDAVDRRASRARRPRPGRPRLTSPAAPAGSRGAAAPRPAPRSAAGTARTALAASAA